MGLGMGLLYGFRGRWFLMSEVPLYLHGQNSGGLNGLRVMRLLVSQVQGYLAHKNLPPPLGPPYDPRYAYCSVLGWGWVLMSEVPLYGPRGARLLVSQVQLSPSTGVPRSYGNAHPPRITIGP